MTQSPSPPRATWLGSAGLTVLVGCPCGRRLDLPRRPLARRGFTICDGCRAVILYGSLIVLNPDSVEEFMAGLIRQEEERDALRQGVERELRRFVRVFDTQPEWLWSPATVRLVRAVRPKLELLGGPIGQGAEWIKDEATPEDAYRGDEEDEYWPEDVADVDEGDEGAR